jgi:hypothetical protein
MRDTETNGSAQRFAGGCRRRQTLLLWEARDYGVTTWSPACHEQLSWRFHWWRHSHSVPVRWPRAGAVVEVLAAAVQAAVPAVEQAVLAVEALTAE